MFLPIRTETEIRTIPWGNLVLLGLNMFAFLLFDVLGSREFQSEVKAHLILYPAHPNLLQFFSYQFLHGDVWHLAGNMLFLWLFGNAVNNKMGSVPYFAFYLAGGVFAGLGYAVRSEELFPMLGASGSIAAVTTAYLILFPKSRVKVLFIFIFIGFIEVPAMILIGVKIILWDNIIAPGFAGAGNVAIEAHLAGYVFGFCVTALMLLIRAVPRDQFDLMAVVLRWFRRRAGAASFAGAHSPVPTGPKRMARPIQIDPQALATAREKVEKLTSIREKIADALNDGHSDVASGTYEQLVTEDPEACLSEQDQLRIARQFYGDQKYPQAAAAFERYLKHYARTAEAVTIRLLLGIIYARELHQYETAERHLTQSWETITQSSHREQCREWLVSLRQTLGKPIGDLQ